MPFTLKHVEFITSVFDLKQRPKERLPEIAVAGTVGAIPEARPALRENGNSGSFAPAIDEMVRF